MRNLLKMLFSTPTIESLSNLHRLRLSKIAWCTKYVIKGRYRKDKQKGKEDVNGGQNWGSKLSL